MTNESAGVGLDQDEIKEFQRLIREHIKTLVTLQNMLAGKTGSERDLLLAQIGAVAASIVGHAGQLLNLGLSEAVDPLLVWTEGFEALDPSKAEDDIPRPD